MKATPPRARTNADWLANLRALSAEREAALADLRVLLLSSLRLSLTRWIDVNGPEFEPLAQDVAQEALLKILDHLDTFRGESRFTTWANKIAVHVALTELRRRKWRDVSLDGLLETESGDVASSVAADSAPGPEEAAEQALLLERVQRIIEEELTAKQRRALVAATIKGMPLAEVARRMNTNRNALYKLLHDARRRVRRRLAREGLTPDDVLRAFERG